MIDLLLFAVAMIAALRFLFPWLRIAIMMVMKLIGFAFFIAIVILVAIAILMHGAFL